MTVTSVDRVPRNTAEEINRGISRATEERVRYFADNLAGIDLRLRELDQEWDIERVLETNASSLAFAGLALAAAVDKRWLVLPGVVTAFLFQQAVQGWCPPMAVLRRMGYRTAREIYEERAALKALRGDFGQIGPGLCEHDTRASHALLAARL